MGRTMVLVALGVVAAAMLFSEGRTAVAAGAPTVTSIVEGRDAQGTRPVLVVIGKGVARFKTFSLSNPDFSDAGAVDLLFGSGSQIAIGLPATLAPGTYTLALHFGRAGVQSFSVKVDEGAFLPLAGGSAVTGRLTVSADDGAVFGGAFGGQGTIPASGAGTRFMWYPTKAAIRAGQVFGTQWDDANIGTNSVAMGTSTTASGSNAVAMGGGTTASGFAAFAMGGFASAATGNYSVAMGGATTASGLNAVAMGGATTASGDRSTAFGDSTVASGFGSVAMGGATTATGSYATALGLLTTAQAYSSLVIGRFNVVAGTPGSPIATDPVFVAGNGSSAAAPSNALTLLRNGDMTIAGTLTQNSDVRLKTDVVPLTGVLAKLSRIDGVAYRFVDENRGPAGPQVGLIAQQVREAFPELVRESSDGTLSVAYGNFTAVLLAAVKEQQAEIAALREELQRTKDDVASRVARLEALAAKAAEYGTR